MTYKDFIQNILNTRGRFNCGEKYHERHHIVPKCMDGNNDEDNLIDLYAREHFVAHKLLAEENPHNKGLQYAWWNMAHLKDKNQERYICTEEEYEDAKIAFSSAMSGVERNSEWREKQSKSHQGQVASFKGKHHTEETKKELSAKTKEQIAKNGDPFLGRKHSKESIEKMRKAHTGIHPSEDTRKKLATASTGRFYSKETRKKISESKRHGNHPFAKKVSAEGISYGCIRDCADHYGIEKATMAKWLRENKIPQKYQYLKLHYIQKI